MDDLNSPQNHAGQIELATNMNTSGLFSRFNDAVRVELRIGLEAADARWTRIIY